MQLNFCLADEVNPVLFQKTLLMTKKNSKSVNRREFGHVNCKYINAYPLIYVKGRMQINAKHKVYNIFCCIEELKTRRKKHLSVIFFHYQDLFLFLFFYLIEMRKITSGNAWGLLLAQYSGYQIVLRLNPEKALAFVLIFSCCLFVLF